MYRNMYANADCASANCMLIRVLAPLLFGMSALASTYLWDYSPWWACLTAVLIAAGISYSIFCCCWNTENCKVRDDIIHV